jgi:hypothetical protein
MNSLSPEARQAALLQSALRMREEMDRKFTQQFGSLEPPSGEIADLAKLVQERMADTLQRAQSRLANTPPDPETMRHIEAMLKQMIPGHQDPEQE